METTTTLFLGFDRRKFISRTARGIFAATLAPEIARFAAAAEPAGSPAPTPTSAAQGDRYRKISASGSRLSVWVD